MDKTAWISADIGSASFHACIADSLATPRRWASLPTRAFALSHEGMNQFVKWVAEYGWNKHNIAGLCIEATGRYSHHWSTLLKGRLGPISIVNPARPKAYGKSLGIQDKSDRVDACVLALYATMTCPKPTNPDTPAQRELRELCRLRHSLEVQHQANLRRLADRPSSALVRASLKKAIGALKREIQRLDDAMDKLIRNDDAMDKDFKRAKTVKGIGTKTAIILLAEFGDLRQYNRDEFVALAGLYPREYTSGTSVYKRARLAKAGKSNVRAALYMCAMSAIRANHGLAKFAERLKENGKNPMQILGAVMRKLLMLVHAVIVTETDYDPNYQSRLQCKPA